MVQIEVRLELNEIRDLRGTAPGFAGMRLALYDSRVLPTSISVAIPESDARKLWQELGRKLRNVNKEEEARNG